MTDTTDEEERDRLEAEARDAKKRMWETGHENERLIEALNDLREIAKVISADNEARIDGRVGGIDTEWLLDFLDAALNTEGGSDG